MKLRLFFALLIVALAFSSCTDDQLTTDEQLSSSLVAQKEFAGILSKAVYDNQDLRAFLKSEANLEVDNDYDIFYPWSKDKVVSNGRTLRETLLQYCDSEEQLDRIENALPLLTILIPDLSWISDKFSDPQGWNVEDPDVLVTYRDGNDEREILQNGKTAFCLEPGEFTDGTILVVKNNERIIESASTKGGSKGGYSFIADIFDNTKPSTKQASYEYKEYDYPTSDYSDFVSTSDLNKYSPYAVQAYNKSLNAPDYVQRDFCYYDFRDSIGTLRRNVEEGLFRFRFITTNNFANVCDDHVGSINDDPEYSTYKKYDKNNGSVGDSFFGLMADGHLEICFDYGYGELGGGTTTMNKPFDIFPKDVLQVSHVREGFKHKTAFNQRHWTYEVTFVPKWYYLPFPVTFFNWDLSNISTELWIHVKEIDSNATTTNSDTRSVTWKFTGNVSDEKSENNQKNSGGITISYENNHNTTVSCSVTNTDNNLGWAVVKFTDEIITGTQAGGYKLKPYYCGNKFEMNFIPHN